MAVHYGRNATLYVSGDKAYLIDTAALKLSMFEPMPMLMPPPEPQPFRVFMDHGPVIKAPQCAFLMCDNSCGPEPAWQFAFLFPLGKRAYVRKR